MDFFNGLKSRLELYNIVDRLGTLLLALVLALIVWLVAINRENPIVQGPYSEEIPIDIRGLPAGLGSVQDLRNQSVSLTIKAPQNRWGTLSPDEFTAFVDLTGLEAGSHEVPIKIEVPESGVTIIGTKKSNLMIELDKIITQSVPITIDILDFAAEGYRAEASIYQPLSVQISGPRKLVYQVQEGVAGVFLRNTKQQVESTRAIVPVNSQGEKVEGVSIDPLAVDIVVPVVQIPGRKEVAVNPDLVGQPDSSHRLTSVIVEPNTVVLQGDNEILSKVPGSVFTEPLLLTGATTELRKTLALVLPDGVTAKDRDTVSVVASITPIESSTRAQRSPVLDSLGDGLEAEVALDTVTVILSGPVSQLNALDKSDVRVVLDLSGLLPGTHTVTPHVELPNNISQDGVLPETVEVVISSLAPTPVPRMLLPPTPTRLPSVTSPLGTPDAESEN